MAEMTGKIGRARCGCAAGKSLCRGGMPLALGSAGESLRVKTIRGGEGVCRFLRNLGFIEGAEVSVVNELGGNLIVNVKGSRVAVSRAMASRILTE